MESWLPHGQYYEIDLVYMAAVTADLYIGLLMPNRINLYSYCIFFPALGEKVGSL